MYVFSTGIFVCIYILCFGRALLYGRRVICMWVLAEIAVVWDYEAFGFHSLQGAAQESTRVCYFILSLLL